MRRIGVVDDRQAAERICAFFVAQSLECQADSEGTGWAIWIHDEARVAQARDELQAFLAAPDDPRFRVQPRSRPQATARVVPVRKAREVSRWKFTQLLIIASALIALRTGFGKSDDAFLKALFITPVTQRGDHIEYPRFLLLVLREEPWRLITPIFLHFSPLHLVFNCLSLSALGGPLESRYGRGRLLLFVVFVASISNLAQYYWKGPLFGGLSGVIYGMFGFLLTCSWQFPDRRWVIANDQIIQFFLFTLACLVGWMGPIANACHLAGFAAGVVAAYASRLYSRLRR